MSNLNPASSTALSFIKQKFKHYYLENSVEPPVAFEKREFGFGNDKKIDFRHHAFKTPGELNSYFRDNAPLYASFSVAFYDFPAARPMPKKVFRGADLVFEFDAECEKTCAPACEKHLNQAKADTVRLIEDFLVPDFGFARNDIRIAFSGNRGFHIYVDNDTVKQLNGEARRQISDYLQARDLDVSRIIRSSRTGVESGGWRGRLVKAALEHWREQKNLGKLQQDREHLVQELSAGNFDLFRGAHSSWAKLLEKKKLNLSSSIDQSVTLDVSKLIRLPSTLHGSTGLKCAWVKSLDAFDVFSDAVAFKGNEKVRVKPVVDLAAFSVANETIGSLKKDTEVDLGQAAGMLLICKGLAVPAVPVLNI